MTAFDAPNGVAFTVPGRPVGKQRPRITKNGRYTPEATLGYEGLVRHTASLAMSNRPVLQDAVTVRIIVWLSVPQSWSNRKRTMALGQDLRPASRPDLDNIVKSVADGINGVVYRDDCQIVRLVAEKRYGLRDEVEISVWREVA